MWRHTGWSHQNGENWVSTFSSKIYFIWKSIRRGANHRKPLFDATRMSPVMGLQKYFSAPPGSIVFLKKRLLWFFFCTVLYKIRGILGSTNLSLLTKIVWFQIFIFWLNNVNLRSTKNDHVTFSDIANLFSRILCS